MHLTTAAGMIVPESMHTEVPSKVLDDNEEHKKVPLCRLISLNKPEIPVLLLGTAAAVVAGVLFPMLGLLISSSIKSFYEPPHQLKKDARFWTLMYVAAGIVSLVSLPMENFLFGVAGGKLVERIRSLSFKRIVHQEVSWFDNPSNARSVSNYSTVVHYIPRFTIKSALRYLLPLLFYAQWNNWCEAIC